MFRIFTTEHRTPAQTQSRNFLTSPYATYFHEFPFLCYDCSKTGIRRPDGRKRNVIDCVHLFKFKNNLIEGTRAQMSSGSK